MILIPFQVTALQQSAHSQPQLNSLEILKKLVVATLTFILLRFFDDFFKVNIVLLKLVSFHDRVHTVLRLVCAISTYHLFQLVGQVRLPVSTFDDLHVL